MMFDNLHGSVLDSERTREDAARARLQRAKEELEAAQRAYDYIMESKFGQRR